MAHYHSREDWYKWFMSCLMAKIDSKDPNCNRHTEHKPWHEVLNRVTDMIRRRIFLRRSDLNGLPDRLIKRFEPLLSDG